MKNNVVLFRCFGDDGLAEIVGAAREVTFEIGEALIESDQEGRFLGVLLDGKTKVSVSDDAGQETVLAHIGPGDLGNNVDDRRFDFVRMMGDYAEKVGAHRL